jgi:integrase
LVPGDAAPTDAVIPSRLFPVHGTVRADFDAAGIPARDAEGRCVDFHSLRTTFVTWLAMTGAHPRSAQALARHGSIDLTMNVYTDLRLVDLKGTVERLPLPAVVGCGKVTAQARA